MSVPDIGPVRACVQLPLITSERCPGPELAASLALQRAHTDGVAKLGQDYLDHGCPTSGLLAKAFDKLAEAGLVALADPDPHGLRPAELADAIRLSEDELRRELLESNEVATPLSIVRG